MYVPCPADLLVVNWDELEQVLALPLAGDVDHEAPARHAVGGQAGDEGLESLELGWSEGQHFSLLSAI